MLTPKSQPIWLQVKSPTRIYSVGKIVSSEGRRGASSFRSRDDRKYDRNHLSIAITARDRDKVRQLLAIEGNVQFARLASESNLDSESESRFDIPRGLQLPNDVGTVETELGQSVVANGKPLVVESSYVSSVSSDKETLTVYLSQDGQQALLKHETDESKFVGLGLIVDGTIEAFAAPDDISGRRITFVLSGDSKTTADAIVAAVRGPALLTDLELLD